ncbi:glycosyltransferase family 2 protein [Patescibacteria group bacterium]|nr:glycosyltransferase family 2 protein [Patescibacteria group bacterium]
MQKTKLVIYIPSYNRGQVLSEQLERIVNQWGKYRDRIRLVISDNFSSDPVYKTLSAKFIQKNISFRRNISNIGGNENIMQGFLTAGEDDYLWILSDDDMLTSSALEEIFWGIDKNTDIIHIGETERIIQTELSLNNVFTITKGAGFGLTSVVIFSVNFIKDFIYYGFEYMDSSFPHFAILLSSLREHKKAKLTIVRHKYVFTKETVATHGSGDYFLSAVGFGYLSDFLEKPNQRKFLWDWITSTWPLYFAARRHYPAAFHKSEGYLRSFGLRFFFFLFFAGILYGLQSAQKKILMAAVVEAKKSSFGRSIIESLKKL